MTDINTESPKDGGIGISDSGNNDYYISQSDLSDIGINSQLDSSDV